MRAALKPMHQAMPSYLLLSSVQTRRRRVRVRAWLKLVGRVGRARTSGHCGRDGGARLRAVWAMAEAVERASAADGADMPKGGFRFRPQMKHLENENKQETPKKLRRNKNSFYSFI